jgi:NADH-quinone oxidoreductase subunit J
MLIAALHSATLLVYVLGPLLHKVLIPVAAIIFVLAVPVLKNPVHSLLCLLALFASMAITFLGAGAEYLALVFLIVYVGGLAILFLFVVMLLNPNDITKTEQTLTYSHWAYLSAAGVGALTYLKVAIELFTGLEQHFIDLADAPTEQELFEAQVRPDILALSELYDGQWPLFGLITAILLLAMLGAIIVATTSVSDKNENNAKLTSETDHCETAPPRGVRHR